MKKILISALALFAAALAPAQTFQSVFTYGSGNYESGSAIAKDPNGNLITAGYFDHTTDFDPGPGTYNLTDAGNTGNGDAYIASYTQAGALNWVIQFGTTTAEFVTAIDVDAAGDIYATGAFMGTVDFDPGAGVSNITSAGGYDWFVAKFTNAGALVWATSLQGADFDMPHCIRLYQSGVYVGGYETMSNLRTGYLGVWDAVSGGFGFAGAYFGNNNSEIQKIEFSQWGDMYVTGYFRGTPNFDLYSGSTTRTSNGGDDVFLAKYSTWPTYALQWVKSFGGTGYDQALGMTLKNNDVFLAGTFSGTMDADPNAGVVTLTGTGITNMFISRIDQSGVLGFAKAIVTSGVNDEVNPVAGITMDASGNNILVSGQYRGSTDFDPGAGTDTHTSVGDYDAFLAKYDYSGNYAGVHTIDGMQLQTFSGLVSFPSGDLYGLGNFTSNFVNFDPGNTDTLVNGIDDIFVAHYFDCVTLSSSYHDTICNGSTYTFGSQLLTTTGMYRDTLSSVHGCDSVVTLYLYVVNLTMPPPTVSGDTLSTYAYSSAPIQWFNCGTGLAIPGETDSTFIPATSGDYAFIISWAGCSDTSGCTNVLLNSIAEAEMATGFSLYPNPASGNFILTFTKPVAEARITITDISGKIIFEKQVGNTAKEEIVFDGAPGVYFVTVRSADTTTVHRLVRE